MLKYLWVIIELSSLAAILLFLACLIVLGLLTNESYRRQRDEAAVQDVPDDASARLVQAQRRQQYGPNDEAYGLPGAQTPFGFYARGEAQGSGSQPDFARHDPPFV